MDRMIEKYKVNECCCFDLRTGALIVLWLSVFGSFPTIILTIFPVLGIYGIYTGNDNYLKIHVIYSIIATGLACVSGTILFICAVVLEIQGKLKPEQSAELWAYFIVIAIAIAFNIYFVRVVASLYLTIKQENAGIRVIRSTNDQQDEILVRSPQQQQQYSTFA